MINSSERHPLAQPNQVDGILQNPRAGQLYNVDDAPETTPLNVAVRLRDVIVDVPSEAISTVFKLLKELGSVSLALAAIAAKKLFNHQK